MQKVTALDDILRFAPLPSKHQGSQIDAGAGDENLSRTFAAEQKQHESQYPRGRPLNEESRVQTDIYTPSIFCRIGYL